MVSSILALHYREKYSLTVHILHRHCPRLLHSGPSPSGTPGLRPCFPASSAPPADSASSHDPYTELPGSTAGSNLCSPVVVCKAVRTSTAGGFSQVPSYPSRSPTHAWSSSVPTGPLSPSSPWRTGTSSLGPAVPTPPVLWPPCSGCPPGLRR